MKKVLILAYDFPPYVSVGGLRPYSWYKYFREFNIYPIVVTRQWANQYGNSLDYVAPSESDNDIIEETTKGTIIKTPYFPNLANRLMMKYGESKYRLFRKFISAFYEFAQFLFIVGPKSQLYKSANSYLSCNQVDVIIATGDPFVLFSYAKRLSDKYNIPWIADYRDPWSQKIDIQNNFFLKRWNTFFEKRIVSNSNLITTVSVFFENKIEHLITNKKIVVLPNGFDPEVFESIKNIKQQHEKLKIAYVGYIYDWHPIRSFLTIISLFFNENKFARVELNFYGINDPIYLEQMIRNDFESIQSHIKIHRKLPNEVLMQKLSEENLMLLFNYYSFPGTKIYDYLALKRKILFCYSDDPEANKLKKKYYPYIDNDIGNEKYQEKLIVETNSGLIIKDSIQLLIEIKKLYSEFLYFGEIQCNTINVECYSRKHQVEQLASLIKTISLQKN